MKWLPSNLDYFTLATGLASVLGFAVSIWTLLVAKSVKRRIAEARRKLAHKVVEGEILPKLPRVTAALSKSLNRVNESEWTANANRLLGLIRSLPTDSTDKFPRLGQVQQDIEAALAATDPEMKKTKLRDVSSEMCGIIEQLKVNRRTQELRGDHVNE